MDGWMNEWMDGRMVTSGCLFVRVLECILLAYFLDCINA